MEITLFVLPHCPYCKEALKILKELYAANPKYSAIVINTIDETANEKLSDQYDYDYVPCFFLGKEKIYEASPRDDYDSAKSRLTKMLDDLLIRK